MLFARLNGGLTEMSCKPGQIQMEPVKSGVLVFQDHFSGRWPPRGWAGKPCGRLVRKCGPPSALQSITWASNLTDRSYYGDNVLTYIVN